MNILMADGARQTAGALLRARYIHGGPGEPAYWNDVLGVILANRSVRRYRPDPVPDDILELLVAAAQSASNASNLQTWSVVAIRDQARKDRLAELCGSQKHVRQCPLFLVWVADISRAVSIARAHDAAEDGAHQLDMLLNAVIGAALAAQNAVLTLQSLGLASVYIGGILRKPEDVAAELALPSNAMAVFGLCIGYEDAEAAAPVTPRLPQRAVLHHETYTPFDETDLSHFDDGLRDFNARHGIEAKAWIQTVLSWVGKAPPDPSVDRIRQSLNNLGFRIK